MSSILKALKKLEQDPTKRAEAIDLWQMKPDQENSFAKETRRRSHRIIAFNFLFFPLLAIGGWLLLKYVLIPTQTSQPVNPMLKPTEATSVNIPKSVTPTLEKTDLKLKSNSTRILREKDRKGRTEAGKIVIDSRTKVKAGGKKAGKPSAAVKRTHAKTQLKPAEKKPQFDSKAFQKAKAPVSDFGSPSMAGDLISNNENPSYQPSAGAQPSHSTEKPAISKSSVLPGFSVQAIAWSKSPAERVAVINGHVVREGGFVEGMHVTRIDLNKVSLKKGDNTWLLQCGR